MSEDLIAKLLKAKEKTQAISGRPPYAIIMRDNEFNLLMDECKKQNIILPRDPLKLHGLIVEKNNTMPSDQILIIPEDMYIQMKKHQASTN